MALPLLAYLMYNDKRAYIFLFVSLSWVKERECQTANKRHNFLGQYNDGHIGKYLIEKRITVGHAGTSYGSW